MDVSDYLKLEMQALHKHQGLIFGKRLETNIKSKKLKEDRKEIRNKLMSKKRLIASNLSPYKSPMVQKPAVVVLPELDVEAKRRRLDMLKEWKQQKQQKIAEVKAKSKPLFKVTHVSPKIGLPNLETVNKVVKGKLIKPQLSGKKKSPVYEFAPKNHQFKPPSNIKPIQIQGSPTKQKKRLVRQKNVCEDTIEVCKSISKEKNVKKVVINAEDQYRTPKKTLRVYRKTPAKGQKKGSNKENVDIEENRNYYQLRSRYVVRNNVNNKIEDVHNKKLEDKLPSNSKAASSVKRKSIKQRSKSKEVLSEHRKDNFSVSDLSTEYPIENYTNSSQSDTLSDVINTTQQISTPVSKNNPIPYISPFVTINRGKDSARKEFHSRKSKGGLCDSSPEMQSNTGPRAGAVYFHKLLDGEISRIQGLCNEWNLYKDEQNPPEEACDMINVAIGQSQLLLNKKFKQFRDLINSCESGDSEQIITCEDLHGYWDTAYMQVENLNQRFENLVNLRANNWEEIIPVKKVVAVKKTAKVGYKPKVQASSRLRDAIKAARNKAKTVQETQDSLVGTNVFDGGFFAVHSPEKSPKHAPTSRNRNSVNSRKSLLVDVLTTQALKQENSPGLIMIKATQTAKAVDNTTTTPGSSILKTDRAKFSGKKSKSVLFKEADADESEEKLILFTPDEGSSKINTRRSISNVKNTPKSVLLNDNVPVGKLISFTPDEVVDSSRRSTRRLTRTKLF